MKTRRIRRCSHRHVSLFSAPAAEILEQRQVLSAAGDITSAVMAADQDLAAERDLAQRLAAAGEQSLQASAMAQDATQAQLLAPSGRISERRPEFRWSDVGGAARYEIWVQSLSSNQRVLYSDRLIGTSATASVDLPDGDYRWWIRAFDGAGRAGSWSLPRDFSLAGQSAGQPVPQTPVGRIDTGRPEFRWTEVSGAARYELWVSSLDANRRVLHGDQITSTSAQGNVDLAAGSYRWWVRAFNAAGQASDWSSHADFVIVAQQPVAPVPQSPTGTIDTGAPRFEWSSVSGAVRYELWVTNNDTRQRVVHSDSLTGTSAVAANSLPQGSYTWWVRAFDAAGRGTNWSSAATFQITASLQPRPVSPTGTVATGTPQFEWTALAGAVRYELWVSSLDANQRVLHSDQLTGTTASISQGSLADGNYRWWVRGFDAAGRASQWSTHADFTIRAGAGDDQYEDNDNISHSADLGTLTQRTTITGLSLADGEDWFTFIMNGTGTSDNYVATAFDHSLGDIDLKLYDAAGRVILLSDGTGNQEVVSLNGLSAGRYFVQVYGYQGSTNPSWQLDINPASGSTDGGSTAYRTLFVNFDGVRLSRQDLERYGQGRWQFLDALDEERDGVAVNPFLANNGGREQAIRDIMGLLQQDLSRYGITVQRITGGAVEGHGATTIFVGPTNQRQIANRQASGIASDIDRGNDNPTDIAIVADAPAGLDYQNLVYTMADTILHEAGHTWGLHHVETLAAGQLLPETMGYVYTVNHHQIRLNAMADTAFLDVTFHEIHDHGLRPGVMETQNSHQLMAAAFGSENRNLNQALALVDLSQHGVFAVQSSSDSDQISVTRLSGGQIQIDINGHRHVAGESLDDIRIYAAEGRHGDVRVDESLAGRVTLLAGSLVADMAQKVHPELITVWNGTESTAPGCHDEHDHADDHDLELAERTAEGHDHDSEGLPAAIRSILHNPIRGSSEVRTLVAALTGLGGGDTAVRHPAKATVAEDDAGSITDMLFSVVASDGLDGVSDSLSLADDVLSLLEA